MSGSTFVPPPLATLARAAPSARSVARRTAFWSGALLPLAYVPMLAMMESGRVEGVGPLATLLAANVVALLVGYGHEPGR